MIQFYLLSVLCNAAAGYMLIRGTGDTKDRKDSAEPAVQKVPLDLILGLMTGVTGIFKILSAIEGDAPVIGDIIPAGLGIAAGGGILFEYYRKTAALPSEPSLWELFFNRYKRRIGFLACAAAVLHFLFPRVTLI
jgi:hypothetical protein